MFSPITTTYIINYEFRNSSCSPIQTHDEHLTIGFV